MVSSSRPKTCPSRTILPTLMSTGSAASTRPTNVSWPSWGLTSPDRTGASAPTCTPNRHPPGQAPPRSGTKLYMYRLTTGSFIANVIPGYRGYFSHLNLHAANLIILFRMHSLVLAYTMGELCAPPTTVGNAAWHKHRRRSALAHLCKVHQPCKALQNVSYRCSAI